MIDSIFVTACVAEEVTPTKQRGSYALNGRIHVGRFGHPDANTPAVTDRKVIANEAFDSDVTYLYPRWTKDQSAVVCHSNKSGMNQLYMYRLKDGSTVRVLADSKANYMFLHGEATPK